MNQSFENVRQQFDRSPYPRQPLDKSPRGDAGYLYKHHVATAYYRRHQRVLDPKDKVILDAGCGSGYKALALAFANPGARIVGIDFSEESVKLARTRLAYHGIEDVQFEAMAIEDVAQLGQTFDYINCDEVLYLLPDPEAGLRSLKSVLKPDGILRGNLHNAFQRANYFRAQKMFQMMGLMDDDVPDEMAIALTQETMEALKDFVELKTRVWQPSVKGNIEGILANYLLRQDRGFTVPDMEQMLANAGLAFVSMVNWRQWNPYDLFANPDDLPAFLGMSLPQASPMERLHLYELLHPIHRLLDFWCGHPEANSGYSDPDDWDDARWNACQVYLHPLLQTPATYNELAASIRQHRGFAISQQLPVPGVTNVFIDSVTAVCLLPLYESSQPFSQLVRFFQETHPLDPVSRTATSEEEAIAAVRDLLRSLESMSFVFLTQPGNKTASQ